MVLVRLGTLRTTSWCESPTAVLIDLDIGRIFQLPSLALGRRFACHFRSRIVQRSVHFITSRQACVGVCKLRPGRDRARDDAADSTPYAGEHATEFALDAWLTTRGGNLGLSPLHSLRKRRDATLAIDLLNGQKVALARVALLAWPPRRIVHRSMRRVVRDGWRRWAFFEWPSVTWRRLLSLRVEKVHARALRRVKRLGLVRRTRLWHWMG